MRASILSPELRLPHWIDLNILWPQHGCQRMGYAAGDPVIIAFSGKCHSVLGKSTKIDQDWPNIMSKNYKQKKKSFIKRVENPQGELFGNRYIKIHAVDLIIVIQPLILVSSSSYVRRPLPPTTGRKYYSGFPPPPSPAGLATYGSALVSATACYMQNFHREDTFQA